MHAADQVMAVLKLRLPMRTIGQKRTVLWTFKLPALLPHVSIRIIIGPA